MDEVVVETRGFLQPEITKGHNTGLETVEQTKSNGENGQSEDLGMFVAIKYLVAQAVLQAPKHPANQFA